MAKYSLDYLIPKMQDNVKRYDFWTTIDISGGGKELIFYFVLHLIFTGKYHRAFLMSIFIASNFFVTECLQLLY